MNVDELVAIDVHTHAEISVRDPQPPTIFQEAAQKYFKHRTTRSRRSRRSRRTTASARWRA